MSPALVWLLVTLCVVFGLVGYVRAPQIEQRVSLLSALMLNILVFAMPPPAFAIAACAAFYFIGVCIKQS